jgi:hypothetical protein
MAMSNGDWRFAGGDLEALTQELLAVHPLTEEDQRAVRRVIQSIYGLGHSAGYQAGIKAQPRVPDHRHHFPGGNEVGNVIRE